MVSDSAYEAQIHCFGDSAEAAERLLSTFPNAYIGITGCITFDTASALQGIVKDVIPLSRLLIETDAPYMTPRGFGCTGRVCHPGHCIAVAAKIAELKGLELDEVLRAVRENTTAMYGI